MLWHSRINYINVAAECCVEYIISGTASDQTKDVSKRISNIYGYVLSDLALAGSTAVLMFRTALAHRILARNPCAIFGCSLAGMISSYDRNICYTSGE